MSNINIMQTPGYPRSGGTAMSTTQLAYPSTFVGPKHVQRERFTAAVSLIVRVQAMNADLPCDVSATTSERRT